MRMLIQEVIEAVAVRTKAPGQPVPEHEAIREEMGAAKGEEEMSGDGKDREQTAAVALQCQVAVVDKPAAACLL